MRRFLDSLEIITTIVFLSKPIPVEGRRGRHKELTKETRWTPSSLVCLMESWVGVTRTTLVIRAISANPKDPTRDTSRDTTKATIMDSRMELLPIKEDSTKEDSTKEDSTRVDPTKEDSTKSSEYANAQIILKLIDMEMKKPNVQELTTLADVGVIPPAQATAMTLKDPQSTQATHGPMKPAITTMDKSETRNFFAENPVFCYN